MNRRRALAVLGALSALPLACKRRSDRVVVGSKNFSESVLLGEIVAQAIEKSTGLSVERKPSLGGTFVCHQGLVNGDLDVYVEYTGTALVAILKDERRLTDPAAVRAEVERAWEQKFGAVWTAPLGFDDTFAILVRRADAEKYGLSKVSDLSKKPLRPGFGYEFVARKDGYEAFVAAYGVAFAGEPATMELDLTYRALADGKVDVIAGNSTDGRIDKLGLVQLTDDKRFFPPYEAAPVVRKDALQKHPQLGAALASLGRKIDVATMRRLNAAVDVDRKPVGEVARTFLAG
ncbi:MAG: glycine betaine ABC transporter substrate-binding protein [Polyangiales bacterium]